MSDLVYSEMIEALRKECMHLIMENGKLKKQTSDLRCTLRELRMFYSLSDEAIKFVDKSIERIE